VAGVRPNIEPEHKARGADDGPGRSRDPREAALSAIESGHVYLSSDSYSDAIAYFRVAERDEHLATLTAAEAAGLYASLARSYLGLGKHDEARECALEALSVASRGEAGDEAAEAHVVLARIDVRSGRFQEALEAAEKAYSILRREPDSPLIAEASKVLGSAHAELGNTAAARDCFTECLVTNRRLGNEAGVAGAYNNLGILAKRSGDLAAAVEYFERALEIDSRLGRPGSIARRLNNLGVVLYRLSRWSEAEECLRRAWQIYSRLGAERDVAAVECALGGVFRARRQWGAAREHLERVVRVSRERGYLRSEAIALEFLGELEADQGRHAEALRVLGRAHELARRLGSTSDVVAEVLRRRAEVLLATGRLDEAERDCTQALELTRRIGDRLEEGSALRVLSGIAFAKGTPGAGEVLSERAEEVIRRTGESFELARVALGEAVGLRLCAKREVPIERIEARLSTAEDLFARMGALYWVGRCRLERSRSLLAVGDGVRARSWLESARPEVEIDGDSEGLREIGALTDELDAEVAAAGAVGESRYSVIADGYRFLESTTPDAEALHALATRVAAIVSADRLALFSVDEGGRPVFATAVGRTGRRLAEVRRVVRAAADGHGSVRPVVLGPDASDGKLVPRAIAAVAAVPADPVAQEGRYVLYADRLRAGSAGAFSAPDIDFMRAAVRVLALAHRAIEGAQPSTGEGRRVRDEVGPETSGGFITADPGMLSIVESVARLRSSTIPILVQGESGVGKEVLARWIHEGGRSRTGRFVALNAGAIPQHLQESELFGHVKGAFTDADRDRPGLIEAAADGTLFLDEIGEMGPELQVKLLRFLQSGEYRRVGESRVRTSDVRVISASNRNLRDEVAAGRFRGDLFYRLGAYVVEIPPLRERRRDTRLLMDHFLELYATSEGKHVLGFAPEVYELFLRYDWRGNNVRELENEVRRGVALCDDGGLIGVEQLSPALVARREAILHSAKAGGFDGSSLREEVEALERRRIHEALEQAGQSKRKAASLLGLSRTGLYTKLRKYGIG
jgi:DNA-binding NtrC family response regulator/tetratricopeptide (TPR) repeat protein